MVMSDPIAALPQVRAGTIKAYGVTTKTRLLSAPDIQARALRCPQTCETPKRVARYRIGAWPLTPSFHGKRRVPALVVVYGFQFRPIAGNPVSRSKEAGACRLHSTPAENPSKPSPRAPKAVYQRRSARSRSSAWVSAASSAPVSSCSPSAFLIRHRPFYSEPFADCYSPFATELTGDGDRDRSCCSPLFCDLLGHLLQKCGDLFDVVGRYLGRTEHARRLRLDRAQHSDRLLERHDVEFRRSYNGF